MYGSNKSKELPGIHGASQNRQGSDSTDLATLSNSYQYKKRNASGNHRNIMQMHNNQQMGAQYIHGTSNSLTPSKVGGGKHVLSGIRGNTDGGIGQGNLNLGPGGANSKTPKEAYKRI